MLAPPGLGGSSGPQASGASPAARRERTNRSLREFSPAATLAADVHWSRCRRGTRGHARGASVAGGRHERGERKEEHGCSGGATTWGSTTAFSTSLLLGYPLYSGSPYILWPRCPRGLVTPANGRTTSRRKPSEQAAGATDGKAHLRRQTSAWGDEVGPHASADKPPEARFSGLRSGSPERGGPPRANNL